MHAEHASESLCRGDRCLGLPPTPPPTPPLVLMEHLQGAPRQQALTPPPSMAPPPAPPQPLPEQLQPRGAPQQAPVPPAPATALSPVSQSASDMTTVSTPKEFQDAIVRGVRDIEIRAHLDMRASQRLLNPDMDRTGNEAFSRLSLLYAGQGLRSIRVRPKSQPMTWQNLTCDMQMPASTWHART